MKCIYRWVHMSDIHFQTREQSFNTKQLKDTLPKYLSEEINGGVDGLFLTGDYRYAPDREANPIKAVEYILKCAESLKVSSDHIYAVPGNHDLARSELRTIIASGLKKNYDPDRGIINEDVMKQLVKDFKYFDELEEQLHKGKRWGDNNPHTIVDAGQFYVLLLNTALVACGDEDKNELLLGSSYIQTCISRCTVKKPIIMIGHHGFDWLQNDENKVCIKYLENQGIALYLCGHNHEHWISSFGENGKQVNVGCFLQDDKEAYAGFAVGEVYDDGEVKIYAHKWDRKQQKWVTDPSCVRENLIKLSFESELKGKEPERVAVKKKEYPFSIDGYRLLGSLGEDGIKYYWKKNEHIVESIAFNKKHRISHESDIDSQTSAYTISTSIGCGLSVENAQCLFCGTGEIPFIKNLKPEEIALQCIFMAEYDSNCTSYPQVRDNKREFAFMGQGEPGLNYTSVREAILLNDIVMQRLGQKISRYIICTSRVTDFMPSLIEDIKNNVFINPISVHFSLNAIEPERSELMPMNKTNDYHEFIDQCKILYNVSKRKISVRLLMFSNYCVENKEVYSLTASKLEQILEELDPEVFNINLCTLNKCGRGKQKKLSNEDANKLLDIVKGRGFEGKILSSFGESQESGFGMLKSQNEDADEPGQNTIMHFNRAVELLNEAKEYRKKMLEE